MCRLGQPVPAFHRDLRFGMRAPKADKHVSSDDPHRTEIACSQFGNKRSTIIELLAGESWSKRGIYGSASARLYAQLHRRGAPPILFSLRGKCRKMRFYANATGGAMMPRPTDLFTSPASPPTGVQSLDGKVRQWRLIGVLRWGRSASSVFLSPSD